MQGYDTNYGLILPVTTCESWEATIAGVENILKAATDALGAEPEVCVMGRASRARVDSTSYGFIVAYIHKNYHILYILTSYRADTLR